MGNNLQKINEQAQKIQEQKIIGHGAPISTDKLKILIK